MPALRRARAQSPMKEPVGLAVATASGALTSSLGAVLGIPLEAPIAGLIGGLVAIWLYPSKRADGEVAPQGLSMYLALACSVFVSVAAASFLGPYTAALFHLSNIDGHLELKALSFLWGVGAQAGLLATAVGVLRGRIELKGTAP